MRHAVRQKTRRLRLTGRLAARRRPRPVAPRPRQRKPVAWRLTAMGPSVTFYALSRPRLRRLDTWQSAAAPQGRTTKTYRTPACTRLAKVGLPLSAGLATRPASLAKAVLMPTVRQYGQNSRPLACPRLAALSARACERPDRREGRADTRRPRRRQEAVPFPLVGDAGRPTVAACLTSPSLLPAARAQVRRGPFADVVPAPAPAECRQLPCLRRLKQTGAARPPRRLEARAAPLAKLAVPLPCPLGHTVACGLLSGLLEVVARGRELLAVAAKLRPVLFPILSSCPLRIA